MTKLFGGTAIAATTTITNTMGILKLSTPCTCLLTGALLLSHKPPDNNFHGLTFWPKYSTKHPPATLIIAFESPDRAEERYQRYFPLPKSP